MLIEFKVANFRSIREQQTLSLVASKADKELPSNLIERNLPGLAGVKFLKGAAIYGANASGKSNVIEAIRFLASFVENSAVKIQPGDPTGTQPFKLDRTSASKPSEFEVTFVAEGTRFLFGLVLNQEQVLEEYLIAFPKGNPQRWYHRTFNPESCAYEWARASTAFKQDKSLQEKTRNNSLFLSVGPQFNHPQLSRVFNWFKDKAGFIVLSADSKLHPVFTAELIRTKSSHYDRVLHLLQSADVGVIDARVQLNGKRLIEFSFPLPVDDVPEPFRRVSIDDPWKINLTHGAKDIEPVSLDFENEESEGTRRFFSLAGPWIDILDEGHTVFIDEIETSLHPVLVRELLKLLFSKEHNPKGAQVIFTTHNPVLLDNTLMRRDQIWFTEKTEAGTTRLYPLTDYQPRKDEAIAKGYLAGRYGAVPYIPEGLQL